MTSRRTLTVVAALVLGAVAAVSLFSYVDGIEARAYGDAKRVRVYVVDKDVPKGLPGEQAISDGYIDSSAIPQEFRPGTALTERTIEGVRSRVALNDLSAGQVVVDGMFVDPEQAYVSSSQQIEEGLVAITVSVDEVRGVAGLVVPGDRVNLLIDDPAAPAADPNTPEAAGAKVVLYQNVEVLAIGSSLAPDLGEVADQGDAGGADGSSPAASEPAERPGSNLVTFSVPPEAASRIALVGSEGIWLTLVPPSNKPVKVPVVTAEDLVPDELTPYPDEEL